MTLPRFVALIIVCAALAGRTSAAPVNVAIDIDSVRCLSGTDVTGTFTTQPGFTSWNLTDVGTAGSTMTVAGVTYEIFGLAAANQSRVRTTSGGFFDPMNEDFVFNEGAAGLAVGLRITGLEPGTYGMRSWHYDPLASVLANENFTQIEVRNQGGTGTTVIDMLPFSQTPASFQFQVTAAGQVKEIIFREDDVATATDATDQNRARLNGFTLTTVPEPGTLALVALACLAACAGRRGATRCKA